MSLLSSISHFRKRKLHAMSMIPTDDWFNNLQSATKFQKFLYQQDPNISKSKIKNLAIPWSEDNKRGGYKISIYRKNAITNIQVNNNSEYDQKIHNGFLSHSIHHLSINPMWRRNGLPEQMFYCKWNNIKRRYVMRSET